MDPKVAAIFVLSIIFLVLCSIFVPLRCYARLKVIRILAIEDWSMVIALILFFVDCGILFKLIHVGLGKHQSEIDPSQLSTGYLYALLYEIFYALVMLFAKISICLLLLRLMANRIQKGIIYAVLFVIISVSMISFIGIILQCKPMAYFWDRSLQGTCQMNIFLAINYLHSVCSIVTDWTLALLPFFVLWRTKLSKKTKIGTAVTLSLGALASIFSIVKAVYIHDLNASDDLLASGTNVLLWSLVEEGSVIIAGCLATFRPLFVKIKHRVTGAGAEDEESRGRTGRPRQPFDTSVQQDWDPGLTIGQIHQDSGTGLSGTGFSEDLIIQRPSSRTQGSDGSSVRGLSVEGLDADAEEKRRQLSHVTEEYDLEKIETIESYLEETFAEKT